MTKTQKYLDETRIKMRVALPLVSLSWSWGHSQRPWCLGRGFYRRDPIGGEECGTAKPSDFGLQREREEKESADLSSMGM